MTVTIMRYCDAITPDKLQMNSYLAWTPMSAGSIFPGDWSKKDKLSVLNASVELHNPAEDA